MSSPSSCCHNRSCSNRPSQIHPVNLNLNRNGSVMALCLVLALVTYASNPGICQRSEGMFGRNLLNGAKITLGLFRQIIPIPKMTNRVNI